LDHFSNKTKDMQNGHWFWATSGLLACYMAVILFFVVRGARRTHSINDYAVGSMGFSPVVVGLSLAASITSAATFVINPGFIALFGWSAFLAFALVLPLGLFLSLIVLTKSFRRYGSSVKALTMPQWIGQRYGSPAFALFFAVLSLLLLTFIVLICVGMTKVLAQALGMGEIPVLIGLVIFVFGYMMFGGANAMVYTNTVQAGIMLLVAFMMLGSGYEHFSAGIMGFWEKIASVSPDLTLSYNAKSPVSRDFFEVVICNFVVGVAIVCQPHIITKSLMLRDERDVNRYLLVGISAEIIFFLVVFTGFYARVMFPDLKTPEGEALKMDGIIPAYVVHEFPVWAGLIVILGLLSAGLSTLEGLIQSVSTTISQDLITPLMGKAKDEKGQFARHRLVIVALGIAAVLMSKQQLESPNLSVGIFAQNGVYAFFSAAFVPVLFGIFLKDTPRMAVIGAAIMAVVVHFGTYYGGISIYLQGPVRNPAVAATYAILASVMLGLSLHFTLKKSAP
jgi:sodium/pantothenate symporter